MDTPLFATPRVAAGALIRDTEGRILLVKPTYKDGWEIPGGYVEPGESPAAACRRELREELRVERLINRLLLVDWAPHPEEGDKLLFIFDGDNLRTLDEVTPDGAEIEDIRLVAQRDLPSLLPERLSRRILTALHATNPYAEYGLPVTT